MAGGMGERGGQQQQAPPNSTRPLCTPAKMLQQPQGGVGTHPIAHWTHIPHSRLPHETRGRGTNVHRVRRALDGRAHLDSLLGFV